MNILPPKVNWRITSICDMAPRCNFCFAPVDDISNSQIRKLICNKLIEKQPKMVVISGGEPTKCKDLIYIIKELRINKIKVCLATNGTALLEVFPDFFKYINVLTLPLEGMEDKHSELRSNINFKRIITLLNFMKKYQIQKKYNLQILVNTVLVSQNRNDLEFVAKTVNDFDVDVWKIFEYLHYEKRNPLPNKTILNVQNLMKELTLIVNNQKTKIMYEDKSIRNNRYFMINPSGTVVLPEYNEDAYTDIPIASFIDNNDDAVKIWNAKFDNTNYEESIKIFNL